MSTYALLTIGYEAFLLAVVLSAGPALAAFVASVIVGAMQAATQVQDVTLTFVPKIAAALTAVVLLGAWSMNQLSTFTTGLLAMLPKVAQQGG